MSLPKRRAQLPVVRLFSRFNKIDQPSGWITLIKKQGFFEWRFLDPIGGLLCPHVIRIVTNTGGCQEAGYLIT
jgi:hypothetical protein